MELANFKAYDNGDGTVRLVGNAVIDGESRALDLDIPKPMIDLLLVNAKRMGVVV